MAGARNGRLGPTLGPMVIFAAAIGMRPGEWVALEWRDIDHGGRVAYVLDLHS
jgi:integrase